MGTRRLDVAKKQHRERGQVGHRQKLGLLEKHKDYVLRAKDYHSKQDRLKKLRGKAALRNEDEFYFGMIRGRTERGVHVQDTPGTEALPNDVARLLKSQDIKYIQTLRSKEQKKIAKLQDSLSVFAAPGSLEEDELELLTQAPAYTAASKFNASSSSSSASSSKHTYFTEDLADLKNPKVIAQLKQQNMAGSPNGGPSSSKKGKARMPAADEEHKDQLVEELRARLGRDAQLARVERDIQVQKHLMGKGAAKQLVTKKPNSEEIPPRDPMDDDDDEMGRGNQRKPKLPPPQQGIRTGARVYKWKSERRK